MSNLRKFIILLAATSTATIAAAQRSVLMISVDGLKPEYVTHADEHHLQLPTLRRVLAEGAHAEGVIGAFPSVTYPNHTTLVTGVAPAVHGIVNNQRFDPTRKLNGAWYWYEDQIHVPTLWSAAHAAQRSTASIGWPVTANARDIDFLIPEYWRGTGPGDAANPDDTALMSAISRPAGELDAAAGRVGQPYMPGNDTSIAGDEIKTRFALDMLEQHHPQFMTLHLSSLDEEQHLHGPFSPEANEDLETIDGMLDRLITQELANDPDAVIAIVSDHGFAPVEKAVNFYVPFVEQKLFTTTVSPLTGLQIASWRAEPWLAGGMAAIMLHDPTDTALHDQLFSTFSRLAQDPANGIEALLTHAQTVALGGFPEADFVVTLRAGYVTGVAFTGPFVTSTAQKGTHGYNPATTPAMHASFFIMGKAIAQRDLGTIDMRRIAPTLASLLKLDWHSTEPAIDLH